MTKLTVRNFLETYIYFKVNSKRFDIPLPSGFLEEGSKIELSIRNNCASLDDEIIALPIEGGGYSYQLKDMNETPIENTCCQGGKCEETSDYEARTFPAGKVVKLAGFPVKCTTEVTIEAHPGTWEMIDEWETERAQGAVECGSAQGGHLVCAGKTDCRIG